jgi:hypothetical protein
VTARGPADIVQAQLDAYNARDVEAMCALYAEDCVIADLNGAVSSTGRAALRARYAALFEAHPHNRARLANRIVIGSTVIDHEDVSRGPDGPRFEVAAIYAVRDGLIARVDFVKAG